MAMVTTAALVVAGFSASVLVAPAAAAAVSPIAAPGADLVTADALPTVQIDGVAWSQAISGNTVFAGGSFTTARPAGAAAGVNTTPRSNLLSYNLTTGVLNTSFAPVVNGTVQSVAVSPDGSRVYIAGDFTSVNGQTANRVAALNPTTGALITTFAINIGSRVKTIVATNTTVYVGGLFTAANGQLRSRLAAYNAANGGLLGWNPGADDNVNAMVLTPDGSKLIVGGSFQNVAGQPAYGLAAIDATTGAQVPWEATTRVRNAGANAAITSLSTDGTTIYGTGYVFGSGGNLEGAFSADPNTGALTWVEDCHGDTYGAYSNGETVYTVSHAHYCGNVGGFYQSDPWGTNMRHALAFTKAVTGTLGKEPFGGNYANWEGTPSPSMVNWFPTFTTGKFTGQDQAAWTVTGNGQYVVMGGEFPSVNGTAQQGLVRFATKPTAPSKRAPQITGSKFTPSLLQTGPKTVKVSFQANWDQDDMNLTYRVVRNSNTAAPVYTTTADSTFWNRPNLGFVDQLAAADPAGTTYRYRLYVTDSAGNQVAGDTVTITTAADAALSSYASTVLSQGADTYLRLDESSGTTAIDWAGNNDATVSAGVTRGAAGAINGDADTASTFSGTTTGLVATKTPLVGPNTFTTAAWVKTTSTTGGQIIGFGNLPVGTSNFFDRSTYMDNAGRILFAVNNGAVRTINTTKSYNDGQWHQVVTSLGADGMTLYVDGLRVAKRTDVTTGRAINGFWRIGGDSLNGFTSKPSSGYLNGSIDEVSIYPTVLTRDQIVAQYVASGRVSPIPAAPADAYGAAVYADQPDLFWRLGESSGTVAADASASVNPGNYTGGVTLGAAGSIDGLADTAATFNGSNGLVASAATFTNPTTYSQEAWFRTTTTTGGKIIGFGSAATGLSTNYDRHVWMLNDGKIAFGANTGVRNIVTSPTAYNNGQWHQVVATQGADGMKLYLDGQLVGSNAVTGAQNYTGYWRVGGDRSWNSTSNYFNGTIDEASVYSTVLSAQRVAQHYKATGRTLPNLAPSAAFTAAAAGLTASVDATTSSDPDGTIASYAWNFGDGGVGTGVTAAHTYAAAGNYTITLTVTDDAGSTNTTTRPVTVTNAAPVAAFTSNATDLALSVDGTTSADPDGTIASYAWNFGDGGGGTGVTASHTYAASGSYDVTLTVTDNAGASTATTSTVVVTAANALPTAAFTSATQDLTATVDAAGSTDPDGTIAGHAWEFGDGATGTGVTAEHTYAAAGSYQVKLTVTDNRGGTATQTATVTVAAANVAPVAAFTSATTGLTATLNGSTSSDPDGSVAGYAWTFGDGTTGTGASTTHAYTAAGTYTVELTVTDNKGLTNAVSKQVTVALSSTIATDAFARTVANAWGSADAGGAWTMSGAASLFSSNGSAGQMRLTAAGAGPSGFLNAVAAADLAGSVDIAIDKVPTGSGFQGNAIVRRGAGTGTTVSDYRIKLRLLPTSTSIQISKVVNNVETTLSTQTVTGLTYAAGDVIRLSFKVAGTGTTTLNAKAWKVGTTEPAGWRSTVTDSDAALQRPGSFGLQGYLTSSTTNAPVVASFDNLAITVPSP